MLEEKGLNYTILLDDGNNFLQIQQILKATFQSVLNSQQSSTSDEEQIVDHCLDILKSLLMFDATYWETIYDDETYIQLLVEQGLLSDSLEMRNQFKNALGYICENVNVQPIENQTIQPARFFLHVLKIKLP